MAFLRGTLATLDGVCSTGTCWSYRDVAHDAASEMVGRVSGMRYQEAVKRDLFAPLGMTSASVTLEGLTGARGWARPHSVGRRPLEVNDDYYRGFRRWPFCAGCSVSSPEPPCLLETPGWCVQPQKKLNTLARGNCSPVPKPPHSGS